MKIKLVFDSGSGRTKKEVESLGAGFFPIIININGEDKLGGIDVNYEYLKKVMTDPKEVKIRTSAATPQSIEEAINSVIDDADKVLVITMSKHVSSTNETAKMVVKEKYSDKVFVYDSELTSPWLSHSMEDIVNVANKGDWDELMKYLEDLSKNMYGFILPESLKWLYGGGRITKTQYLAGSLMKIKPIIIPDQGSLNRHAPLKARGLDKAIKLLAEEYVKVYKKLTSEGKKLQTMIATYGNFSEQFRKIVTEILKSEGVNTKFIETRSDEGILAHTGPNVCALLLINKK